MKDITRRELLLGTGATALGIAALAALPKVLAAQGRFDPTLDQITKELARLHEDIKRNGGPTRGHAMQAASLGRTLGAYYGAINLDAALRASVQARVNKDGKDAFLDQTFDFTHPAMILRDKYNVDITGDVANVRQNPRDRRAAGLDMFLGGAPLLEPMIHGIASSIEARQNRFPLASAGGPVVRLAQDGDCSFLWAMLAAATDAAMWICGDPFLDVTAPEACGGALLICFIYTLMLMWMGC